MCRKATHEQGVPRTWNNVSLNLSSLKDLYGAVRKNFQNVGSTSLKFIILGKKATRIKATCHNNACYFNSVQ